MYAWIPVSFFNRTISTFWGDSASDILPASITDAMGIALYGMFRAVILSAADSPCSICNTKKRESDWLPLCSVNEPKVPAYSSSFKQAIRRSISSVFFSSSMKDARTLLMLQRIRSA